MGSYHEGYDTLSLEEVKKDYAEYLEASNKELDSELYKEECLKSMTDHVEECLDAYGVFEVYQRLLKIISKKGAN